MLKRFVTELTIPVEIVAEAPVLVRSGFTSLEILEEMAPVMTRRNGREEPLIPGSSLKGVLRSHAERIMRTLSENDSVCDPFSKRSCGERLRNSSVRDAYADSCPACRLFGSTVYSSRFYIDDAYIKPGTTWMTESRDRVGIDRFTGGAASRAKFELRAVSAGARWITTVRVQNFECWQLGIVLTVLRDLQEGYVRIGSETSSGFGAVRGIWDTVIIDVISRDEPPANEIWGLGRWLGDGSYGTQPDDVLTLKRVLGWERNVLRWRATVTGEALEELQRTAADEMISRVQRWPRLTKKEVSRR